jgi:glycosyltransferase involved in cell wall biosynthesis
MLSASLIISFYNNVDYLKFVLAGLNRQSFKDFEIIIADDGSNEEAVKNIEIISSKISLPLIHLWQEDRGFRKNKILNRAIISSSADYLIFIDGDCIPHTEFIKEHFENRRSKICLTGRRVNLSKKITDFLTEEKIKEGWLEKNNLKLIYDGISGESFDVEKGFYFRQKVLRNYFNRKKRGLLGCNFSLFKKDMLEINGFDERYEAPSIGEDSDVQFRLELNGIEIKSLNNIAVQYHLFHKLQERPQKNLDLFNQVKKEKKLFTPYGIIQETENS